MVKIKQFSVFSPAGEPNGKKLRSTSSVLRPLWRVLKMSKNKFKNKSNFKNNFKNKF